MMRDELRRLALAPFVLHLGPQLDTTAHEDQPLKVVIHRWPRGHEGDGVALHELTQDGALMQAVSETTHALNKKRRKYHHSLRWRRRPLSGEPVSYTHLTLP